MFQTAEDLVAGLPLGVGRESGRKMLKISRSSLGGVVFRLTGRMNAENLGEVESLLESEMADHRIVLDLEDLTLVDREAIRFLAAREARGVVLRNCPPYIREWITREGDTSKSRGPVLGGASETP